MATININKVDNFEIVIVGSSKDKELKALMDFLGDVTNDDIIEILKTRNREESIKYFERKEDNIIDTLYQALETVL